MLLPQQVQSILYHVIAGWMYGCTFLFLRSFILYMKSKLWKGFFEIIYHILFTLLMFRGLYKINGGITNFYLITFFLIGFFIFYRFYMPIVLPFFHWLKRLLKPIIKKGALAKSKILGIMRIPLRLVRRRKANGSKRKKKSKKRKKEKSFEEND